MVNLLRTKQKRGFGSRKKTDKLLKKHAKKRALARYHIELNNEEIADINKQIMGKQARLKQIFSINRSLWAVTLPNGEQAYTIFDKKRKTVVTFLTEEMVAYRHY